MSSSSSLFDFSGSTIHPLPFELCLKNTSGSFRNEFILSTPALNGKQIICLFLSLGKEEPGPDLQDTNAKGRHNLSRVTQGHHQHLAASFHSLEVFRRGLGSTNNGVWLSLHRGQSDSPGLSEKVRHEGSREHRDVGMSDVLREEAAASDLPLSRGAQPQTTTEYEQNKPLQSPEDLTLLLMSGVSSCSKQTAGIIHTSPEFRHPRQQFANSPFPSTPLSQQTVCFDYNKKICL